MRLSRWQHIQLSASMCADKAGCTATLALHFNLCLYAVIMCGVVWLVLGCCCYVRVRLYKFHQEVRQQASEIKAMRLERSRTRREQKAQNRRDYEQKLADVRQAEAQIETEQSDVVVSEPDLPSGR